MFSKEEREAILGVAEEIFFVAMLDGYAGDKKNSVKTVDEDGYKIITFVAGIYKVVDRYCVTPISNFSAGTTTIFYRPSEIHQWMPVWWMSYAGNYPKKVIPFLKTALKQAYEMGEFIGGRGLVDPFIDKEHSLIYENDVRSYSGGHFEYFGGEEKISVFKNFKVGEVLGFHKFFGMALI
jgi:hypothetical protein